MKTHHAGSTRKRIRQGVWAAVLTITGSFALVYPGVAQDLRSFDQAESYLADGQTITLTQRLGQAIIQFDPTVTDTTSLNEITAPNNKRFTLEADLRTGRGLYRMQSDESVTEASNTEAIQSLNSDSRVKYVYPVFADPASGARHFLNDEIVVRLKARITPDDLASFQQLGLKVTDTLSPSENIHVLRLSDPKNYNPFRVCAALLQNAAVLWDEPNMGQEGQPLEFIPDDQIFNYQWHLKNTGQYGATAGADVEATFAWDTTRGSPGIRIAILDNGFETGHEDLADNLIQGYDFYDLDADPNPSTDYDNHGTPVAGIASAAINNGLGLAGVAGGCQILPVRMFESIGWVTHVFPGPAQIYQAIIYAADNADVLNCSWKVSASSTVSAGFQYARDKGRGGMGCAVFCASGNSAAGEGEELGGNQNGYETQQSYNIYNLVGAGSFRIGFEYWKDASGSANDDTVWLADITLPDETLRRLDSLSLPSGWITDGHVSWSGSNTDPVHAHGTSAFAWRAGVIGDNQASRILTSPITVNSSQTTVKLRIWMSSLNGDQFRVRVYDANANFLQQHGTTRSGPIQGQQTAVFYPANLSTTLAVGASTDFDYRSHYSQYDSTLTFVACSGGGIAGIYTTDRTGTAGYNQDDQDPNNNPNYVSLSGTSAASPLAAGIAALVLSKNGNQNVNVVSDKLKTTCDKIGPVAYTGTAPYTRNDYYGYGRLNANAAVNAATADITAPTFHSATVIHHRAVDVAFNEPMGDGVENPNNYTITAGQGTLSAPNPAKVVRIGKVQVGFGAWLNVYRLIWNSGSLAGSGTVTITASSALKDVAGNSLSGTLSRSGTGTKRVLAVNSGSALELSYTVPYLPYLADNGFQGNEVAKFLTSTADVMTTDSAIDTSGVTDPAPQAVYQSQRISWNSQPVPITWSLPDMPPESLKVRLHFAEIYYAHDQYGYQLFDIHINDILKTSGFDIMSATGGQQNKAVVLEYSNITPQNGVITVTLMPQQGANGDYRAAINGIEVVKP